MANKPQITAALVCHKGCVRGNNEDSFFVNGDYMPLGSMDAGAAFVNSFKDHFQLYGIMDGMGGGNYGERASALAARMLLSVYMQKGKGDVPKQLDTYAKEASEAIYKDGVAHHSEIQGSTMAVVAVRGKTAYVANVGDSRVYLLRDGKLEQLSMDQSVVGEMVRDGRMTSEQARKSPLNNQITNYLGMEAESMPKRFVYQRTVELQAGDRLMLCSDGVSDLISDAGIEALLSQAEDTMTSCKSLVMQALEMSGKDNTTCMVLDVGDFVPKKQEEAPAAKAATEERPPQMAEEAKEPEPVPAPAPQKKEETVDTSTCLMEKESAPGGEKAPVQEEKKQGKQGSHDADTRIL